jgi:RNA polymerase sigma-70 factor (ECF subfamily)
MTTAGKEQFLEAIDQHRGIIHRICRLYTNHPHEHEDLAQEILTQLWKSYGSFRGRSAFSTWMYRVALNTALMYRRSAARKPVAVALKEEHLSTTKNIEEDDVQMLYACIQKLNKLDRAIILLHLEQNTYEEIACITGLNKGTVSVRLVRIRKKLKSCLLKMGIKEGESR